MKLHYSPTSPFVRKVSVTLLETGLDAEVELLPAKGTPLDSSQMPVEANPLGKVPCLEGDDGQVLYDSRVICAYLDARSGGKLATTGPDWEGRVIEATADGIMDAAVLSVYERRLRAPELQSQPWIDGQIAKITRALDVLQSRHIGHLHGPLTVGQIAAGCALGYLDFRMPEWNWREGRTVLAVWYDAFSQRPAMMETAPQE